MGTKGRQQSCKTNMYKFRYDLTDHKLSLYLN